MKGTSGFRAEDLGLNPSYLPRLYCPVWKKAPADWREQLDQAVARIAEGQLPPLFFRADDIGAAGQAFDALCKLFRNYQVPLAMAVVPAWLSDARQGRIFSSAPLEEPLWSWHQHGWRHINWQQNGPECEFGNDRAPERQHEDILQGRQKMERIFGQHFVPVFTPPWNRLSAATVKILRNLQFRGISTTTPLPPGIRLPYDFHCLPARLFLHARTCKDPLEDMDNLLDDFTALVQCKQPAGIVIHHQRMTPFAFEFLEHMLYNLKYVLNAKFCCFKETLFNSNGKQAGNHLR